MNNTQWKAFFTTCAKLFKDGEKDIKSSPNWCSWTTFTRLTEDSGYWQSGLPHMHELRDKGTTDGGTWSQPFLYEDIAHLIVPKTFTRELLTGEGEQSIFQRVLATQDIEALSEALAAESVPHTLTAIALEIRPIKRGLREGWAADSERVANQEDKREKYDSSPCIY
jgi:hypothetical protein